MHTRPRSRTPLAVAPLLLLALTSCAGGIAGGGAAIATALTVASTVGPILSDTAKIGCAVQAVANDLGKSLPSGSVTAARISQYAGSVCAW
jgi:hypothetical protein